MFYKFTNEKKVVTKTRPLRVNDKVSIVFESGRVDENMIKVHSDSTLNSATFVSTDTGHALSVVDGLTTTGAEVSHYLTEWGGRECIVDKNTLTFEYETTKNTRVKVPFQSGEFIKAWVNDEYVDMQVLYASDKKLVIIDFESEDEDVYEIEPDHMPSGFEFEFEVTYE
ncbi:hypothetical protein phiST2_0137 [Vibrio phage phi-ST2]|nr:hypothetical protein phiST2_0137 [Vibrio phage phi-ST2]